MKEYKYLVGALLSALPPEEEQAKLNKYGEKGWELVAVVPRRLKGIDWNFHYFRKQTEANEKEAK